MQIKICGLKNPAMMLRATQAGAYYLGFVLYPASPRAVNLIELRELLRQKPARARSVALVVDADDVLLQALANLPELDYLQLHGQETPRRVAAIAALTKKPLIKALPIATSEDFASIPAYAPLLESFLFDAKPASGSRPGGNAVAFDWRLLAGQSFAKPWFLAGGLTPSNVAEAIRISGASRVDVSSGVERSVGVKDAALIDTFCQQVLY
jgi:phosphoribosylanthranilate isomerase